MQLDTIATIARICHEANRALCTAIGDNSQPTWDDAPEWQRSSAINGVENIRDGKVTRAEQSHESWSEHKLREGWTYGPVKDAAKLEHPCLVPFAELPVEQRAKDVLFFAIASSLLGALEEPATT